MQRRQRRRVCWALGLGVALVLVPQWYLLLRKETHPLSVEAPILVPRIEVPEVVPEKAPEVDLGSLYERLRGRDVVFPSSSSETKAKEASSESTEPREKDLFFIRPENGESLLFAGKKVLVFTMDSTSAYEANAKKGGAAGEITIRKSLTRGLRDLGATVDVCSSDADFERRCSVKRCDYEALVLDAWTWAAPGWRPKASLLGREKRVLLLDFFGANGPRENGIDLPPARILTAFPTFPGNTFLGYAYDEDFSHERRKKKNQVVVWGKDPKHFEGKEAVIRAVADVAEVHLTLKGPLPQLTHNIVYRGHLPKADWTALLEESKAVLGLGDPLLGPTALDAIAHGCVYVDPTYPKPLKTYHSQHPYLRHAIGEPYVCVAAINDPKSYVACVKNALQKDLPPFLPTAFSTQAYRARLRHIFEPLLLGKRKTPSS